MSGRLCRVDTAALGAIIRVAATIRELHPLGAALTDEVVERAGLADGLPAGLNTLTGALADPATRVGSRSPAVAEDRSASPATGGALTNPALVTRDGVTWIDGPRLAAVESTRHARAALELTLDAAGGEVSLDLTGLGPTLSDQLAARWGVTLPAISLLARSWPGEPPLTLTLPATEAAHPPKVAPPIVREIRVRGSAHPARLARGLADALGCPTPGLEETSPLPPTVVAAGPLEVPVRTAWFAEGGAPPRPWTARDARPHSVFGRAALLWQAVNFHFPYLALCDADPLDALLEVADADDLALARWSTLLADGHAFYSGPHLDGLLGGSRPTLHLAPVGDPAGGDWVPVIGHGDPGLLGAEVLAVAGVGVAERRRCLEAVLPASTPQGLAARVCSFLLSGAPATEVTVELRLPDGSQRSARLRRDHAGPVRPGSSRAVTEELGDIRYVDLGRLLPEDVDAALDLGRPAAALVLDLRAYPASTGMLVASRLAAAPAVGALARQPLATGSWGGADPHWHRLAHDQLVEQWVHPVGPGYAGRVVAVVDEGTISQGEHTVLLLEAATEVTVVGGPSAGANGNVATVGLGGGRSFAMSGLDVRHGDGRQLQRVGILPDVAVAPTPEGMAAGVDEVLEAAIAVARP